MKMVNWLFIMPIGKSISATNSCSLPGHCDPTLNLLDWYVGIRHDRGETLWPITACGHRVNKVMNLIKLIDVDPDSAWFVSQFYTNGTLADKNETFKGNVLKALEAIRPLVEAVATLHEKGYVHRDVKPQNVFLNLNNDLILGDFGLVYFEDEKHTRISNTYENVGSRDWMPSWAMGIRIEDVKPTFDVFSLGKLLWSMISGKPILQLWYFDKDAYNLEKLFPNSRNMRLVNQLFAECIVEDEQSCLQNANELLLHIDKTIANIEIGADVINLKVERTCRACGIGKYQLLVNDNFQEAINFGFRPARERKMKIFTCSYCGNVELFSHIDRQPDAWRK